MPTLVLDFGDGHFLIRHDDKKPYEVVETSQGLTCDCPDYTYRKRRSGGQCVHIKVVREHLTTTLGTC